MKPVRLNRKLTLENLVRVPDGAGGFSDSWTPLGDHWAEVRTGIGRERSIEFTRISAVYFRVIVRASPEGAPSRPKPDQRFREGNRLFRIQAVAEYDQSGRFLTCFAYEEVAV